MPKYSIILPVRNGGEYVKACVNSILSQTINNFNLEILDNCSTDGTYEWVSSLNDNRIRLYRSERSLPIEGNWARMLAIPKNEYMTFLGHDDLLDINFLEVMENLIGNHPNASLYQSHFRDIDENGNKTRSCSPMDEQQRVHEYVAFFLSGMSELSIGQVMKSADFNALGGLPDYPSLLFADLEFFTRLIQKGYRATAFEECCSKRVHVQSTTNSSSAVKYNDAFIRLLNYFIALKNMDNHFALIFQRYGLNFLKPYSRSFSHHLLRVPMKQRDGLLVKGFLLQYKKSVDELIPGNSFYPANQPSVKLALAIDNNYILRNIFLRFKKMYSKPILH